MLMKCPECELQVSDKAVSCPHCGYPLKPLAKNSARRKPKRMRLPNGFGQISEIKGMNLRKPFRAMVTVGKTDEGRPICKLLQPEAYFETYNDAYQALIEYNKNPYIFNNSITMQELFESWSKEYFKTCSDSTKSNVKTIWRYCDSIKDLKVSEIRPRHIKYCMEKGTVIVKGEERQTTPGIKEKIKSYLNLILDYAVEYELIDRNYARMTSSPKRTEDETVEHHIPYTAEEIDLLWQNISLPGVDVLLIQCYTGWRPKELELLEVKDVDLEQGFMKGGIKTKAGKNRIVPIHSRIYGLVEKRYNESKALNSKYLFTYTGSGVHKKTTDELPYTYRRYHTDLKNITEKLGLDPNHKPHDGRAHFVTMAKNYEVSDYAIKRIIGHEIKDITEFVYTTRNIDWLKQEIEKIK